MKCYEPLQKRFRALDMTSREWVEKARYPKSRDTANAILYRSDRVVDPTSFVCMAYCLGFNNVEIVELLGQYDKEAPDKRDEIRVFLKLITPITLSDDEQKLIASYNKMPVDKKAILVNTAKAMEG